MDNDSSATYHLQGYCDASQKPYAAVVSLQGETGYMLQNVPLLQDQSHTCQEGHYPSTRVTLSPAAGATDHQCKACTGARN